MLKKALTLVLISIPLLLAAEVYHIPAKQINVTDLSIVVSSLPSISTLTSGTLKPATISIKNPQITATISSSAVTGATITATYSMDSPYMVYVNNENLMNITGDVYPFDAVNQGLALNSPKISAVLEFQVPVTPGSATTLLTLNPNPDDIVPTKDNNADEILLSSVSATFGTHTVSVTTGKILVCPVYIASDSGDNYDAGSGPYLISSIISNLASKGYSIDSVTVQIGAAGTYIGATEATLSINFTNNIVTLKGTTNGYVRETVTIDYSDSNGNTYELVADSFCAPEIIIEDGSYTIDGNGIVLKPILNSITLNGTNNIRFDGGEGRVYLPPIKKITLSGDGVTVSADYTGEVYFESGTISINKNLVQLVTPLSSQIINGTNTLSADKLVVAYAGSTLAISYSPSLTFYTDQAPPVYAGTGTIYTSPMTLVAQPTANIEAEISYNFPLLTKQVVQKGNGTIYMAPIEVILPELNLQMSSTTTVVQTTVTQQTTVVQQTTTVVSTGTTIVTTAAHVPSVALLAPLVMALKKRKKR